MKKRRRNLPLWRLLVIPLVISVGFMIYRWFLVRQDEAIAPREQVVLGTVYKVTHGKQYTAQYSFAYEGKVYRGSEITHPDQCVCDAAVYFDPTNPSTNTLVEYRRKSKQDRWMMHACSYTSIGLAVALACIWGLKKPRGESAQGGPLKNS
jgi:hypothetical protein